MSDDRYTLDEAAQRLADDECKRDGHDLDVAQVRASWGATAEPLSIRCERCGRTWGVTPALDLPFEDVPEDLRPLASEELRERLGFAEGTIVADHVVVKAATFDAGAMRLPLLIHEFAIGRPMFAPERVATVAFLGDSPRTVSGYADLVGKAARRAIDVAGGRR